MALIHFDLTYRDKEGVDHGGRSVTVEAATINSGMRKAVIQATAAGSHPAGWQLVVIQWKSIV